MASRRARTRHTRRSGARAIEPRAPERALAWLVTGPLGHLYGTVADIAGFSAAYWASRARSRLGKASI